MSATLQAASNRLIQLLGKLQEGELYQTPYNLEWISNARRSHFVPHNKSIYHQRTREIFQSSTRTSSGALRDSSNFSPNQELVSSVDAHKVLTMRRTSAVWWAAFGELWAGSVYADCYSHDGMSTDVPTTWRKRNLTYLQES